MGISAKEAAELVGLSKGAVINAIKSGKLSAEKDLNGEWKLEPVELFRVYKPVSNGYTPVGIGTERYDIPDNTPSMQREVEHLRALLAAKDEVIQAKDGVIQAKEDALEDLRRAMLLLTTQAPQPKSWWQRMWGG